MVLQAIRVLTVFGSRRLGHAALSTPIRGFSRLRRALEVSSLPSVQVPEIGIVQVPRGATNQANYVLFGMSTCLGIRPVAPVVLRPWFVEVRNVLAVYVTRVPATLCAYLRVVPYDRVVDPGIAVPRRWPGIGPRKEPGPGGETLRRALRGHQPPPSTCHPIPPAVFVSPERHQS